MTYFDKKAVRRTIFGRPFQFLLPVCAVERTFVEHCAVRQRKGVLRHVPAVDAHACHAVDDILALQFFRRAEKAVAHADPVALNVAAVIGGSFHKDAVHGVEQAVIRRGDALFVKVQDVLIRRDALLLVGGEGCGALVIELTAAVPDPRSFPVGDRVALRRSPARCRRASTLRRR